MIVLLSGKMGSGKTSVAQHLVDAWDFERVSFAGALKADLVEMDFPLEEVELKAPWMRALMQAYGGARRAINPNHWVNIVRHELINNFKFYGRAIAVVIDDVRFPNEVTQIESLAHSLGVPFHLIRVELVGQPGTPQAHTNDVSETSMDNQPFNAVIHAPFGNLESLFEQVELVLGLGLDESDQELPF